jgi:hypothetical protein
MKLFSVEELLQTARTRTGLVDFGSTDFMDGLVALIDSLNMQQEISDERWPFVYERLQRLLMSRLWFAADKTKHPEIGDENIGSPLVIVSLPRTGSTKLHRLLDASGDFQTTPFWKVNMFARIPGEPDGGVARRIQETRDLEQWMYAVSPEILTGHPMFTEEPEEDQWLGESTFRQPFIAGMFNAPGYGAWLMQADPQPVYDYLHDQLQYLQWQTNTLQTTGANANKPWLLKSPNHLGNEKHLTNALEKPRFVVTHRHPAKCIPSITTTALAMRRLYLEGADAQSLGPVLTGLVGHMANEHIKWRDANPDVEVLDLSFREVTDDGLGAARKVYDFCGLELSAAAEQRMRAWEENNQREKHGKNIYSLEMVGVTEEQIGQAFKSYIERYAQYI